jgi:hypothetical protein
VIELFGSGIDDKLSHDGAVLSGGPGIIIATRTAHDPASAIFIATFLRSSDAGHRHGTHWHEGSADLIQLSQALSANPASLAPSQHRAQEPAMWLYSWAQRDARLPRWLSWGTWL